MITVKMASQSAVLVFAILFGVMFTTGAGEIQAENCDPKEHLTGSFTSEGEATITNVSDVCEYEVGLAVYEMFDNNIDNQILFDSDLKTISANASIDLSE